MLILLSFVACTSATIATIIKINQHYTDKFKNNK